MLVTGLLILLLVYIAGANFLVNAALVPSTMEKLDAFSRITQDSMEALVHTDDIQQQNEKPGVKRKRGLQMPTDRS